MRLEIKGDDARMRIVLSRRNLLALLHKLDMPGSARTIEGHYIYVDGILLPADGAFLVSSEDDEEHYAGRVPAGIMHQETEMFIAGGGDMPETT